MLARLQQTLVVFILASATGALVLFWPNSIWLALGSALAVLLAYSILLAIQFVRLSSENADDSVGRASVATLFKAWRQETIIAARVFFWWQPFFPRKIPDQLPTGSNPPGRRGVVFVHGFLCNRAVWTPWFPLLSQHGIPFVAVTLEPVFASIDAYVAEVEQAVVRMTKATGLAPLLVCHSMGGLVARAWVRAHDPPVARVARIVTIGSPHHGTRVARHLPRLAWILNGEQMRHGSAWLIALAQSESVGVRRHFTCVYSNCDNIVMPASTAMLADADNRFVPGVPHVALAMDQTVINMVMDLITGEPDLDQPTPG